jgi:anaerobic magnesium-protoporphyrin IX monomethyl ester cyclase
MRSRKRIRFIEPQGRHARPMNVWITRWPLIGPITLATILDELGYDVRIYNENISGLVDENSDVWDDLKTADVVCLTIMTPTAPRGYDITTKLREEGATGKIAFGGVHATMCPDEALQYGDIVCRGEGESMIVALAEGEVEDGIHEGIPVEDLDSLPTLNHHLIHRFEEDLLAHCKRKELYELPAMTSRGCPYGCVYCSVTRMFGRRIRQQSVKKVAHDLKAYTGQGFNQFFYYDDNFTHDRDWLKRMLRRVAPMDVRFNTQSRIDFMWEDATRERLDKELVRLMRRGGAQSFYIGYETIDEATAKGWKKGYGQGHSSLPERLAEDTKILEDNGFWIHGMFVVGPQHTQTHVNGIVEFAARHKINSIQLSCLTPFPGTPLFDEYRPHLLFRDFPNDWDFFDGTHCVYDHGHFSTEEFQDVIYDAHQRFYRLGGWNMRSIRSVLSRKMSMTSKILELVQTAKIAGRMMKEWRKENDRFRHIVRDRLAQKTAAQEAGTYIRDADTVVTTVNV